MSDDYAQGLEQFRQMVGAERIDALVQRFAAVCPDFEKEVVSVVGGRIWTRGGIDLKTRSLCSICVLAALGRTNALRLNFDMALNNGAGVKEIFEALFQVAVYAGYPAMWDALVMLEEVLAARQQYSGERDCVPPDYACYRSRRPSVCSCDSSTAAGASIRRSRPRASFGKAVTSRRLGASASSIRCAQCLTQSLHGVDSRCGRRAAWRRTLFPYALPGSRRSRRRGP